MRVKMLTAKDIVIKRNASLRLSQMQMRHDSVLSGLLNRRQRPSRNYGICIISNGSLKEIQLISYRCPVGFEFAVLLHLSCIVVTMRFQNRSNVQIQICQKHTTEVTQTNGKFDSCTHVLQKMQIAISIIHIGIAVAIDVDIVIIYACIDAMAIMALLP